MNLFLHGKTFLATAAVAFTLAVAALNAAPNNRTFPPAAPMKKETQIPVSLGKTSLLDIGLYQVTCQSYGKDAILLPPNFMGSDIATGVIYDPSFQQDGKKALLLHSPWKLPAGSTWVDYQLLLPEATPLKLQFAVAMRHGVVDATHSDGVTFSAYVAEPGQEPRELYREHIVSDKWKPLEFDLSSFAGKPCVIRLQVEPGPANNPSFDYSYFGDPAIVAGTLSDSEFRKQAVELLNLPAIKAVSGASLKPLANTHLRGVTPSNILPFKNDLQKIDGGWAFRYEAADCVMQYVYKPQGFPLEDITLQVDGGIPLAVATGAGFDCGSPVKTTIVSCEQKDNQLSITARHELKDEFFTTKWTLGIYGKSLTFSVSADKPLVHQMRLGGVAAPLRKTIHTPYFGDQLVYLPANRLFTCRRLDWTFSNASNADGDARYDKKTDGTRNVLAETGYIAFSHTPGEVFPNIPFPPSAHRATLGPLTILDFWGITGGSFANDGDVLRSLKDYGVDHIGIIYHTWQRYGYDIKLPDHVPANPKWGGDDAMRALGQAAKDCGYLFSLHENYVDMYPDAPSYDESSIALLADGKKFPAWYNAGTKVQSYIIKGNHALKYAKQNAPEIHQRYQTTMAYIDAQTCGSPGWRVDHDATQPLAGMARLKVETEQNLYNYMRKTHGGPFLGEGNFHYFWAGPCDGVEAQTDGENQPPFLDFDLLKIHHQMTNHGMGYYSRWQAKPDSVVWGFNAGSPDRIDKYRAQEIAYGHAGFVNSPQTNNPLWVAKEHHLMHAVQTLYGTADVEAIDYEIDDGVFAPAAIAVPFGFTSRQRIRYDNGATIWINWSPEPWTVNGRTLLQWGFLAIGKDTTVYGASIDGTTFSDFADCPEYVFADARTSFDMPYMTTAKPLAEISVHELKYLGDDKIQISYKWKYLVDKPKATGCFVHFVNPAAERSDKLTFQNDHALPVPAAEWSVGGEGVTGPFTLTVPKGYDYHDITFGLLDAAGNRLRLRGRLYNNLRYHIGRINVKRDQDGNITDVSFQPVSELPEKPEEQPLDFNVRMTPKGHVIDFGPVATDGSVKINRSAESLTIFPYPREKEMTVKINLKRFPLPQRPRKLVAKAPLTQETIGDVPFTIDGDWLVFKTTVRNAGRYVLF